MGDRQRAEALCYMYVKERQKDAILLSRLIGVVSGGSRILVWEGHFRGSVSAEPRGASATARGRAGGGCREGVAPSRYGGPENFFNYIFKIVHVGAFRSYF